MTDTIENLILDLLEWVGRKERTYQETMEAWRTSCPRLTVWEDATDRGFVETTFTNGRSLVGVTQAGFDFLKEKRPPCYEQLRCQKTGTSAQPCSEGGMPSRLPSARLAVAVVEPGSVSGGGRATAIESEP